jgi:hypothetical protein
MYSGEVRAVLSPVQDAHSGVPGGLQLHSDPLRSPKRLNLLPADNRVSDGIFSLSGRGWSGTVPIYSEASISIVSGCYSLPN